MFALEQNLCWNRLSRRHSRFSARLTHLPLSPGVLQKYGAVPYQRKPKQPSQTVFSPALETIQSNCSMVLGGVTGRNAWPFWATIIRYHNSHSFTGCLMHCLLKIQNIVGKKEYKLKWLGLALARPQGCTHNFTSGCKQQELLTCTHWGARSVLHCSPGVRRYFLYVAQSLLPSSAGEEEKQRSVWPQPCFGAFQRVTTAANCPQLQRWCDNQKKKLRVDNDSLDVKQLQGSNSSHSKAEAL